MTVLDEINAFVQKEGFFDFHVFSYSKGVLIVAGSLDLLYFHTLEIHFEGVFAVVGHFDWTVDTSKACVGMVPEPEAYEMNRKYLVEEGNMLFEFYGEYGHRTYVIAQKISMKENTVKYY